MNEEIIMGMVSPYLKENELTYRDFEQIFSMLSMQEQHGVLDVLYKNSVDLVEKHGEKGNLDKQITEFSDNDDFEILYDDGLFSDKESASEKLDERHVRVRKRVYLSNRTLIKLIQDGDAQARQDLCVANRRLVEKWANVYQNFYGSKMEFEDLVQAGMLGMLKAAERFDLSMDVAFSTYATLWIKQTINREIIDRGYIIRIPVHRMEQIRKVMRLDSKYAWESDYNKRIELIQTELFMPRVLIEDCMRLFYQFVRTTSLDLPVGEEEETTLGELVRQEEEVSVEDIVTLNLLREQLSDVLGTLTEREQKVLSMRFGLEDGRERTLEEVGAAFNVTRERIRQIEAKALRKLRHPSRSRKLKDFLY